MIVMIPDMYCRWRYRGGLSEESVLLNFRNHLDAVCVFKRNLKELFFSCATVCISKNDQTWSLRFCKEYKQSIKSVVAMEMLVSVTLPSASVFFFFFHSFML